MQSMLKMIALLLRCKFLGHASFSYCQRHVFMQIFAQLVATFESLLSVFVLLHSFHLLTCYMRWCHNERHDTYIFLHCCNCTICQFTGMFPDFPQFGASEKEVLICVPICDFACFSPLTTNCAYLTSLLDIF